MGLRKDQKVTPKCCDLVQEKQTVFLEYGYDAFNGVDEDEFKEGPERQKMFERLKPLWVTGCWNTEYRCWGSVEIKFCPHCATPMPEIKLRDTKRKISSFSDGGDYCDTCEKRSQTCVCYRPEYAWEPVK